METYKQMYDKAKKGKALKQLTPAYFKWNTKGQMKIGAFVSKASVSSREGGDNYYQYLVETDDGLVKFAMGKGADNDFADTLVPGCIYAFTFQGKEDLKGGRSVNKFEVVEIGAYVDPVVAETKDKPDASEVDTQ